MTISLSSEHTAKLNQPGFTTPEMGIALLIDMAKQGEIDPWDVQVIEVIDRFLSNLATVPETSLIQREATLSQSGQAFLYASMLVLLKADTLAREEEAPEETLEEEAELLLGEEDSTGRLPLRLEKQLRRRAVARPPQKRRVTLQELIDQLQVMAEQLKDRPRRPRQKRTSAKASAQTARTIAHLAHQENLTEVAGALERFLAQSWPQIAQEQEWLDLEELLCLWQPTPEPQQNTKPAPHHHPTQQKDRVGIFWALLLLSAQSKVELNQEEFYQDLKIRALPQLAELSVSSDSAGV